MYEHTHIYILGMVLFFNLGNKRDNKEENETKPSKWNFTEGKSSIYQTDINLHDQGIAGTLSQALYRHTH